MEFFAIAQIDKRKNAELLVVPFWQKKGKAELAASFDDKELFAEALELEDFKAKEGETLSLYSKGKEKRVLLLGLGELEKLSLDAVRRSFSAVCKYCQSKKIKAINLIIPKIAEFEPEVLHRGVAEGLLLANYSFDAYKTEKATLLEKVSLIGLKAKELETFTKALNIAQGVYLARDLVNSNADEITPQYLTKLAHDFEKKMAGIKTKVLGKAELEKEKFGLLLAVNKGSFRDPALIIMEYKGAPKSSETTVIVGKGITFDTGGLLVKGRGNMEDMRCDMAGAAACFGTLLAAHNLGIEANITAVVAATENSIGSKSFKPGDVYTSYLGKTVEIAHTDAEGRLVLADAIAYANKHLKPTRIIDLATLTGAIVGALGEEVAGIMGNDEEVVRELIYAGSVSHERLWPFPLYEDYKSHIKSDIADIKNLGEKVAGAISAAIFIEEFVGDTPWAHLDIAGTAFCTKERNYQPKHGTGFGVRLLIEYLEG